MIGQTMSAPSTRHIEGFSLIELMITVAIVAILASIAYPSYVEYVARSKRNECRSGVMQVLQQQERYFAQYNTYKTIATTESSPVIRNFSGDNRDGSACRIASAACQGTPAPALTACVEAQGSLSTTDPKKITIIYGDSLGGRGCVANGNRTSTETACWK